MPLNPSLVSGSLDDAVEGLTRLHMEKRAEPGIAKWFRGLPTAGKGAVIGAGAGGVLGGFSSLGRDKEERRPFRGALTGALAGGLAGAGAGFGMDAYKDLTSPSETGVSGKGMKFHDPMTGTDRRVTTDPTPEQHTKFDQASRQLGYEGTVPKITSNAGVGTGTGVAAGLTGVAVRDQFNRLPGSHSRDVSHLMHGLSEGLDAPKPNSPLAGFYDDLQRAANPQPGASGLLDLEDIARRQLPKTAPEGAETLVNRLMASGVKSQGGNGVRRSLLGSLSRGRLGPSTLARGGLRSRIGTGGKYAAALAALGLAGNYADQWLNQGNASSAYRNFLNNNTEVIQPPGK